MRSISVCCWYSSSASSPVLASRSALSWRARIISSISIWSGSSSTTRMVALDMKASTAVDYIITKPRSKKRRPQIDLHQWHDRINAPLTRVFIPMTTSHLTTPMIDPLSELAEVLDAILRDLGQVVRYDQVRILLLPSVLDIQQDISGEMDEEATLLITVRESGELGTLQGSLDPAPLGRYPLNRLLMT